jgi:hypothetical protein
LHLAWDQVSSGLEGRFTAFELNASGGMVAWRARLRTWFQDYTVLANGVQQFLKVELPEMDLTILESVPTKRPRQVIPPS